MDLRNIYASDVQSRALDVEEESLDDFESESCNFIFEWTPEVTKRYCSKLFVFLGSAFSGLSKSCILQKTKTVAAIRCDTSSPKEIHVFAHDIGEELLYFVCIDKISPEWVFSLSSVILENLCDGSSEVNILLLQSISSYRGSCHDLPETFIKTLCSGKSSQRSHTTYLDRPCLIEGLAAQFLSQAEITGTLCLLHIIYSTDPCPYFFILDTLKKLGLEYIIQEGNNEKIYHMKMNELELSSHLYL